MVGRDSERLREQAAGRAETKLRDCFRRCRFVDRADDYASDDHLDEAADAYQHEKLCGKGLRRINSATRADRQNLQHDSEANTCRDSASGESAGINHDKRKCQTCFTDNNPMKQAHHFFTRPKETLRFSKNIFQEHAVIKPSPQEDEDERGNDRDNKSLQESGL
jgi:hypothetical protein